jgi:hypothetical protein
VVVAGRTTANPFDDFPVTTAGVDVVEACERAAAGPLLSHEAIAVRALDETLGHGGIPTDGAAASVCRNESRLTVTLTFPEEASSLARAMASVRVVGALRDYDRYATGIDVVTEEHATQ